MRGDVVSYDNTGSAFPSSTIKQTATLQLVENADVRAYGMEQEGVTPIVPVRAVILALHAPTSQAWPAPARPGELWLAFSQAQARAIGTAILNAAQTLDSSG